MLFTVARYFNYKTLLTAFFVIFSTTSFAASTDIYSGDNYGDINEFIANGGARYAGAFSPIKEINENGVSKYQFDSNDGPICLNGGQYEVYTRDQASENLTIHLGGGGVCWSGKCQAFAEVDALKFEQISILNPSLEDNPVKDWNQVYVPYCDGSLFLGDAESDSDGDGVVDRFQYGLKNISAALDVAVNKFPNPRKILLTGSSGGGYGTIFTSILLRYYYPDTPIDVVNDSGIGIAKTGDIEFINNLVNEWNASNLIPESCNDCFVNGHMTPAVDWILNSDSNIRFGMMTFKRDLVIGTVFLEVKSNKFKKSIESELEWLQQRHPDRFHYFLKDGVAHTFLIQEPKLIAPSIALGNMGDSAGGITASGWIKAMITESPKWNTTKSSYLDWFLPYRNNQW